MGQLRRASAAVAVTLIATMTQGNSPAQAIAFAPRKAEVGAAAAEPQKTGAVELATNGSFASSQVTPGRFEGTFSGKRFESQDHVERYLLYRAASLAKQNGASWFGLLYLPGEAGPEAHSPRPGSSRPGYGHWQPHWNYYVSGMGWQPWHPEWGVAFWADSIDLALVERYEAHAMIELGVGSRPLTDQPIFDVDEVIGKLKPLFR